MTTLPYKLTMLDFYYLTFNDQIAFIKNVLKDPVAAKKISYRNSTGSLHEENGLIYSLWCDQKCLLDSYSMKYVQMSTYTKQAFFYFKISGEVVRTNTRDLWGKKDPDSIINTVIEKALKSFPNIDECEVFISPFKKDYRDAIVA